MTGWEQVVQHQIRSGCFTYTDPEWEAICQALHPYQWENEQQQLECRRKLERCAVGYLMGLGAATAPKWHKDELERLNKVARQLDAAVSTLSEFRSYAGPFERTKDLYREREGPLDWLREVADDVRSTAEVYQDMVPGPVPSHNSIAIYTHWFYALLFWTERGLKVDQSSRVINFLVASAAPFAGESVATPGAARRYLRDLRANAPGWHQLYPPFSEFRDPATMLQDLLHGRLNA